MAVEKLDLQAIWQSGRDYAAWLAAASDAKKREEMERMFREVDLSPPDAAFLKGLSRTVYLLALAEDWCGDVRRNVPVVARMAAENPARLLLRCVDKESRPQLMARYLTNGAEAIPIVIAFNDGFVEAGNWGPRPAECKRLIARGKAAGKIDSARQKVAEFYSRDKHQSVIREMRELIEIASAAEV